MGNLHGSFEEWLKTTPRDHPESVFHREFWFHVVSLVLLSAAFLFIFVGLALHASGFPKDLATIVVGFIAVVNACVTIVLLILLTCNRCQRHKNAFVLAGVLHIVCAISYLVVWILTCALHQILPQPFNLMIGMGTLLCFTAAVLYFAPETFYKLCKNTEDPPPPYAEAGPNLGPQGQVPPSGSHQPVPQEPPPPYSSPEESTQQSSPPTSAAAAATNPLQLSSTTQEATEEGEVEQAGAEGGVEEQ